MTAPPDTELLDRVAALRRIVQSGADLLDAEALGRGAELVARAEARLRHGTEFTVVALAGATGSGKSSLFNHLVGEAISPVGVTRPTTEHVRAAVFGEGAPHELLTWLEVRHRHGVAPSRLDGLVLLDLPDHDSVVADHRLEVDRLVELVDVMAWVLDPQKYADEALHGRYLAALSGHAGSMMFLLNQVDQIPASDRARWTEHAASLLRDDGIEAPEVVVVSATTGEGIDELRTKLATRIETRTAALSRLAADMVRAANAFGEVPVPALGFERDAQSLSHRLGEAAGSGAVAGAVAAGYRFDASRHTGWPYARWILRFRRHPLRALQRPAPAPTAEAQPPPTAIPIDHARLDLAIRSYADARAGDVDPAWSGRARTAATGRADELPAVLGSAVRTVATSAIAAPRWWGWIGAVQRFLAGIAAAGAVWLLVLAVLGYVQVPSDDLTPHIGAWPIPTILLLGGAVAGLLVALASRIAARVGAAGRARRARSHIAERIAGVAHDYVAVPVDHEFDRWRTLAADIRRVGGDLDR